MQQRQELATFGAGCFWCVEAVYQRLNGVSDIKSGYMGGQIDHPTYKQICTGTTGHAEVIRMTYDPTIISYETLLEVLWASHDPTTLNQQGADRGTQYRSVIFYHSQEQKEAAEKSVSDIASKTYDDPIVTEIVAATTFYEAEQYHQDYYNRNGYAPYCRFVIDPKVIKLKQKFAHLLKATENG